MNDIKALVSSMCEASPEVQKARARPVSHLHIAVSAQGFYRSPRSAVEGSADVGELCDWLFYLMSNRL
jgi:hypothetical protein